jgi:5-methylcytosine-specific restriction endonuclease McrA
MAISKKLHVTRLRLAPAEYEALRRKVMLRDGWRCQVCGSMCNLEAHHKQFRSRSGSDTEVNLITLCAGCHKHCHQGEIEPS